jgi:hypothetical protein
VRGPNGLVLEEADEFVRKVQRAAGLRKERPSAVRLRDRGKERDCVLHLPSQPTRNEPRVLVEHQYQGSISVPPAQRTFRQRLADAPAESARDGYHAPGGEPQSGQNVSSGPPPKLPQFEENELSRNSAMPMGVPTKARSPSTAS